MIRCNIYRYEVLQGDKLSRHDSKTSPIFITCRDPRTKWRFLKAINSIRIDPEFKGIYARPFMSAEQLQTDRDLVRKLTDLRHKFEEKTLKIHRGKIFDCTNGEFVPFPEANEATPKLPTPKDSPTTATEDNTKDKNNSATTTDHPTVACNPDNIASNPHTDNTDSMPKVTCTNTVGTSNINSSHTTPPVDTNDQPKKPSDLSTPGKI